MKDKIEMRESERGIALISALLSLLVLTTLSAGIIFVTQAGTWTAMNYKSATQARFEAEAGLQRTLQWFNTSYAGAGVTYGTSTDGNANPTWNNQAVVLTAMSGATSNYPTTSVSQSYSDTLHPNLNATGVPTGSGYSTMATLLRAQGTSETWQVTSQGNVPGARAATVQTAMIIERIGGGSDPLFKWAWYGTGTSCQNVAFGGSGGGTDSFDSRLGPYNDITNKQLSGGDIGSNGNIDLASANDINGVAYSPWPDTPNGACKAGPEAVTLCGPSCTITGGVQQLSAAKTFADPPPVTNPTPGTTTQTVTNCNFPGCSVVTTGEVWALAPGKYDNLVFTGGHTAQLSAGTYNVNSFTKWAGTMKIMSGPVVINIAGIGISKDVMNFSSATIANPSSGTSNLTFNYAGTVNMDLTGGAESYALLYAPNAPVTIGGGGAWYGAGIAGSLTLTGGSRLHYDRALGS